MRKSQTPKIDFVITWVDGNDPKWQKEKEKALKKYLAQHPGSPTFYYSTNRYRDWGTLKYWFRAVEQYAPWVNKIHFVTCGHLPEWLDTTNPKLHIVKHSDIIPPKYLPTFNSEAIEANLYKIPHLSENFVYFNDDCFLTNYVQPTDFFKKGKPCATASLSVTPTNSIAPSYTYYNNVWIINKYFDKKKSIRYNFTKWYSPKYGRELFKTIALSPWSFFPGFTEHHLAFSLQKSTYREILELEPTVFDLTSANQFRSTNSINPWLINNWQIASGNFYPRSKKFGQTYGEDISAKICRDLTGHRYKIMCINDHATISNQEFKKQQKLLLTAFDQILPESSSFEKGHHA